MTAPSSSCYGNRVQILDGDTGKRILGQDDAALIA